MPAATGPRAAVRRQRVPQHPEWPRPGTWRSLQSSYTGARPWRRARMASSRFCVVIRTRKLIAVLEVDGRFEAAGLEIRPQHLLGHREAMGAVAVHPDGELERRVHRRGVIDDAGDEADPFGFFRADLAARKNDLVRARRADEARQQKAGAAFGAGQPVGASARPGASATSGRVPSAARKMVTPRVPWPRPAAGGRGRAGAA
jgi:hypothetical protein